MFLLGLYNGELLQFKGTCKCKMHFSSTLKSSEGTCNILKLFQIEKQWVSLLLAHALKCQGWEPCKHLPESVFKKTKPTTSFWWAEVSLFIYIK